MLYLRRAAAIVTKDLHGEEGSVLSDTVSGTTNSTSDVSAVTLAVTVVVVNKVGRKAGTGAKVLEWVLVPDLHIRLKFFIESL